MPLTPLRGLILLLGYLPLLTSIALWIIMYVKVSRSQATWEALPADGKRAAARLWDQSVRRLAWFLVCSLGLALFSVAEALLIPQH